MQNDKINLLDLTYTELEEVFRKIGQPVFRAQQICDWVHKKLIFETDAMLNIPQDLKKVIGEKFSLINLNINDVARSKSDNSYKFLLQTHDNKLIESILMLEKDRATICVSCMIGCPLACKFCATGSQIGFIRKLTPSEIVGQVLLILRYAQENNYTKRISNIVFMGMGEPLLNLESVKKSIYILTHNKCFAISPSRISVSTAGPGSGIADFINKTGVQLAVSLHFPTDELRSKYMPVNEKFPLAKLISELKKVVLKKRDYILIEYLLLGGINDSLIHAKQLQKLVSNLKVKVNLIPYNPTATFPAAASSERVINEFAKYLKDKGIFASVRRSRGIDIEGGCGQFALVKNISK